MIHSHRMAIVVLAVVIFLKKLFDNLISVRDSIVRYWHVLKIPAAYWLKNRWSRVSKSCPWISSITWELVRNIGSRAPPQVY